MHIYRFTNLYLVAGRTLSSDYVVCSSFYRPDRNIFTRLRTMCNDDEEYYTLNNRYLKYDNKKKYVDARMLHSSPTRNLTAQEVSTQVLSLFKTIRMDDLAKAPEAVFWYSTAALIPFVVPPISFLIFGYSPMLATMQLTYAATLSAFAGGMKWGFALNNNDHEPSWENLGWAIVPQSIGWFGLLMPQPLGFLAVTTAIAVSAYIDLTTANYPSWFQSIRLALTIPAILSLFLTFLYRIFH